MKGTFKQFTQSLAVSAGSITGTLLALNAIADLSNPVKRAKIKKNFTNIKNKILKK